MAITATTVGFNAIIRKGPGKSIFESAKNVLSSSSTFYQGDIVVFDTSSKILRQASGTADSANVCGLSDQNVVSGKLINGYSGLTPVDAAAGAGMDIEGPKFGVEASMKVHNGDSLTPGCKLYLSNGDDCQTLTVSDPGDGNYVAIHQGPTATAATGLRYPVLMGARYGSSALQLG